MKRILLLVFAAAAMLFAGVAPAQLATDAGKTGIARSMHLLCASAVAASVTGTTSETVLATCRIPAGAMGLNGGVYFRARFSRTNNTNAHTERVRFGGLAGSIASATSAASAGAIQLEGSIRNRNSASAQLVGGALGGGLVASGTSWATDTKDSTAPIDVVFTGQLATSTADAVTIEAYEVWLLP